MALSAVQAEICDLALKGLGPAEIHERIARRHTKGTIARALRKGRALGMDIPTFKQGHGLKEPPTVNYYEGKPKAEARQKVEIPPLTIEEKARLAEYAKRGIGVTSIAAIFRQPYAVVIAEIERLKLSRAGG